MPLIIFAALIAFAPGFFWLWYVYKKDKYAPEPIKLVINVFFLGLLSSFLAGILEIFAVKLFPFLGAWASSRNPVELALYFIFSVGLIEEICKFLPVWFYVYKKTEFNEIIDGIIYSSASALGFASIENLFYIFDSGAQVMLFRGILSTFGHVLFSAFWGLSLGLAKFNPKYSKYIVLTGFTIAIIAHGLFNVFAYTTEILILLILLVIVWKIFLILIEKSNLLSPFKYNWAEKLKLCAECLETSRSLAKYCGICGKPVKYSNDTKYFCGNCHMAANKDARYCVKCGFLLVDSA